MNFQFFKNIFSKQQEIKEEIVFSTHDTVQVIKMSRDIDIIPGDSYSIKEVSSDGKSIKIDHRFGTRFNIFIPTDHFKIVRFHNENKLKP